LLPRGPGPSPRNKESPGRKRGHTREDNLGGKRAFQIRFQPLSPRRPPRETFRRKKLPQHGGPAAMSRGGDHSCNSGRCFGPVLCINSHRHRHHLCPSARGCFFPAMERGARRWASPTRVGGGGGRTG
ncbi:unnamed protein product, partial [Ectocarpus sp. 4 AP-2014]